LPEKRFTPVGATVAFEAYEADGLTWYRFDCVETSCPEPMINAMCGLKLLDTTEKRLVMVNMQEPLGLYPRIAADFAWEVEPLPNGDVEIIFRRKAPTSPVTDFDNTHCNG